ncbi:hypothetical protein [Kutzneria buriramensis]|uniref:Uncharacterized protein n=1 Tax=Kutzneria buriramensis TaxID=1045776 RepID=A0A3E0HVV7_9PSEU|nr:hypothetical protein [Kutzneria buriramensis]REH50095.1 hypothetical protein BCF44_104366 [Kutzneria buriramensis]
MKWLAIVLTVDALCALVAVVLSWIPAVALPITEPELVAFFVPGAIAVLLVSTLRGRRLKVLAAVGLGCLFANLPFSNPQLIDGQWVSNNHGHKTYYTAAEAAQIHLAWPRSEAGFAVFFLAMLALHCLIALNVGPEPAEPEPDERRTNITLHRDIDNSPPQD